MHKQTVKQKNVSIYSGYCYVLFMLLHQKPCGLVENYLSVRVMLIYPHRRITGLQSSIFVTYYQETGFILVLRS